ncbi:hypothetical protein J2Y74_002927 [Pseudomonas migulae]|nr:hypothetical protein [Pseudomonas migulae]
MARHALAPVLLRGPAAIGHPWPGAANPASMPGCPLRRTSTRPLEGALRSKAEGELTLGLMSGENQKQTRFPVGAGLLAIAVGHSTYLLTGRMPSPASRLLQLIAFIQTHLHFPCRSQLAGDSGGSFNIFVDWTDAIAGTPPAASRLLQLIAFIQTHLHFPCRSQLAGDSGGSFNIFVDWTDAIVGTPPAASRLLQLIVFIQTHMHFPCRSQLAGDGGGSSSIFVDWTDAISSKPAPTGTCVRFCFSPLIRSSVSSPSAFDLEVHAPSRG